MGIPAFYRWLSERYPLVNKEVFSGQISQVVDNLYLDVNGIIHNCVSSYNPNGADLDTISENIVAYLDLILKFVRPRRFLFIAVDGVAPRAKITQQRSRRFRSALDAEHQRAEALSAGADPSKFFDKNAITPGTAFMQSLHEHLLKKIPEKVRSDPMWNQITVHYSGYSVPGEGEHKIVEYIRQFKRSADYTPNLVHCFYGLDSDLIILALSLHERHVVLFREKVQFGGRSAKISALESKDHEWQYLFISILRECLDLEFRSLSTPNYDLERIIDDFTLIVCFCGNDFLPRLPFVYIKHGSFNRLMESYMAFLKSGNDYLTQGSHINRDSLNLFFRRLEAYEKEEYEAIQDDYEAMYVGRSSRYRTEVEQQQFVEYQIDQDEAYHTLGQSATYKSVYYHTKFEIGPDEPNLVLRIVKDYMDGLEWVLGYYYRGCPSWNWVYPHHYAPFVSDIPDLNSMLFGSFGQGVPLDPFHQLLCCLPPQSKALLPESYHAVVDSLGAFYPRNFKIDKNFMLADFEGVVLIPFINYEQMNAVLSRLEPDKQLTVEARKRQRNETVERVYRVSSSGETETSLHKFSLPDPKGALVNYFSPLSDSGYMVGPTIYPLEGSKIAEINLNLFGRPTQNPSLVVIMGTFDEKLIEDCYKKILFECCYCNYPAFLPCVPCAIYTPKKIYELVVNPLNSLGTKKASFTSIEVSIHPQNRAHDLSSDLELAHRRLLAGDGEHVGFGGLCLTGSCAMVEVYLFSNWILLNDHYEARYHSTSELIPVELLRCSASSQDLRPPHRSLQPGGHALLDISEVINGRNIFGSVVSVESISDDEFTVIYEQHDALPVDFSSLIRESVPSFATPLSVVCDQHKWNSSRVIRLLGFLSVGRFELGLHLFVEDRRQYNPLYLAVSDSSTLLLFPSTETILEEYEARCPKFFCGEGNFHDAILHDLERYLANHSCRSGPLFPLSARFASQQSIECLYYAGQLSSQVSQSTPSHRYSLRLLSSHLLLPSVLSSGLLLKDRHNLLDRVQTVGLGNAPEGLLGTVIGVGAGGEKVWVLLDIPHSSGSNLGGLCPAGQGLCLDWWGALNLTHTPKPNSMRHALAVTPLESAP